VIPSPPEKAILRNRSPVHQASRPDEPEKFGYFMVVSSFCDFGSLAFLVEVDD
jgi:hypothetical protein